MQKYLATTQHTVVWFKKIADTGDLVIKAPFQRNPVWSERQRSSLIDTILLEYPIPELYMQEITESNGDQKHIIVDGQQRIRAVLSYIAGEFELNDESPSWPGLGFEDLRRSTAKSSTNTTLSYVCYQKCRMKSSVPFFRGSTETT
ncbi:MAG: DUF262 domain-containing protein [Planctomycetota bacterium]|nr:DUF262 domain-containing protein [Planctomycetota bacterium]